MEWCLNKNSDNFTFRLFLLSLLRLSLTLSCHLRFLSSFIPCEDLSISSYMQ
jgi:hypothetical protein